MGGGRWRAGGGGDITGRRKINVEGRESERRKEHKRGEIKEGLAIRSKDWKGKYLGEIRE